MPRAPRLLALFGAALLLFLVGAAVHRYRSLRPAAITIGPETTVYFRPDPSISVRVHEAVHRRQMREKSPLARVWSAIRYNFDFDYRLREEAEAKAGELCLQIHKFTESLPSFTSRRSERLAAQYRAWAWERVGVEVPDRVGARLEQGRRCHEILADVELDLPPGDTLDEDETLKLAALRFLQRYGSDESAVATWRARLRLAARVQPDAWNAPDARPSFELISIGRRRRETPDSTISPERAGWALHDLTYYDAGRMYAQLHRPAARYSDGGSPVPVSVAEAVGIPPGAWSRTLVERALTGSLGREAVEELTVLEAHPMHEDFETFARAPSVDIVGTRYRFPIPSSDARLAASDLDAIGRAFALQWARAGLAAHRGELEEAARVLRVVIGGALNFAEESPFEADVVMALDWLDDALSDLDAVEARAGWTSGDRSGDGGPVRSGQAGGSETGALDELVSEELDRIYEGMPAIAADPDIPHAFRMGAYRAVSLADVCLEVRTAQDGAGSAAHRGWRAAVEDGLVRRESDRRHLELVRTRTVELVQAARVPLEEMCVPARGFAPTVGRSIVLAPAPSLLDAIGVPGGSVIID